MTRRINRKHPACECKQCGGKFYARRQWAKFCCDECRWAFNNARRTKPLDKALKLVYNTAQFETPNVQ